MTGHHAVRRRTVRANDVEFVVLEAGTGPPALCLHGGADGCIGAELVATACQHLSAGSRMVIVPDAGHFLHLERPGEVNRHILSWVTR